MYLPAFVLAPFTTPLAVDVLGLSIDEGTFVGIGVAVVVVLIGVVFWDQWMLIL